MSTVITTFPDGTYTSSNKPSVETLKTDIQALETGHNELETRVVSASTSTAGTVELATTAETTTGTDTTRAVTPDGLHDMTSLSGAAWFLDEDDMASDSATKVPSQQSVKAHVANGTVTMANKTLSSPVVKAWTGWQLYDTVTPTYTSADDPTYTITFASVDLTSVLSVGMKVKFTNNSTTFYGIITAIAFSTNTVVTLYGGTDYDVANSAISDFYFSTDRAPQGFPMDPTKWTVQVSDTTQRSQSSPVQNTWYNLGSITISIPIGVWDVYYKVSARGVYNSNTSENIYSTLSTANNSESDVDFTAYTFVAGASGNISGGMTTGVRKTLVLAAKTSYYLNHKTNNTSQTTLVIENAESKCIVSATIAYL